MDQVSRPLQVVLAAAVVFAALWFVALRPKPNSGSSSPTPAAPAARRPPPATPRQPGSSLPGGLDRSVAKADQAKRQANQSAQASEKAAGNATAPTAVTPSAPSGARTASATGRPAARATSAGRLLRSGALVAAPNALVRPATTHRAVPARSHARAGGGASSAAVTNALTHGKVVALLFWDRRGSDDRLVHSELGRVSTHGGRALIAAAPIRSVSRYGAVTRGIQVLQSPTVLIIDRSRRARVLTGYTDAAEIGQAVTEALTLRR